MKKILFVCLGNICRSPMAEFIFNYITDNKYEVASRATSDEEIGEDLYYLTKDILGKHNIPYTNRQSILLSKEDYDYYDYIMVFEDRNKENIKRLIGDDSKVRKILPTNIADPWYTRDFETAFQDIYKGCMILKEELK